MTYKTLFAGILVAFSLAIALPAHAVLIGGVDFPQGAASFADAVVSYTPVITSGNPTDPFRGAFNALGEPNYPNGNCATQATCTFVSLGFGGSIVLRFDDNKLTGSGNSTLDLWVFEVGPLVEATFVDISKDGVTWSSVGKVAGSTAGIDIDAFGFGPADQFAFVRLTDDPNADSLTGPSEGSDIDAVGAISTVLTPVPEPGTFLLIGIGLAVLAVWGRRKTNNREED